MDPRQLHKYVIKNKTQTGLKLGRAEKLQVVLFVSYAGLDDIQWHLRLDSAVCTDARWKCIIVHAWFSFDDGSCISDEPGSCVCIFECFRLVCKGVLSNTCKLFNASSFTSATVVNSNDNKTERCMPLFNGVYDNTLTHLNMLVSCICLPRSSVWRGVKKIIKSFLGPARGTLETAVHGGSHLVFTPALLWYIEDS